MVHVTGGFLGQKKKCTLFHIKCTEGKSIQNHSEYPNESETILPPGIRLKVKSLLDVSEGMCIVDLMQIASEPDQSPANNIHIVWVNPNVNKSQENKKTQARMKQLFQANFRAFETSSEFDTYVREKNNGKFLLITSGQLGRQIVPKISNVSQVRCIVLYCLDKRANEEWSKGYAKVKTIGSSSLS